VQTAGVHFSIFRIYGGLNGFWDYGPLGAELKRNIKDAWWRSMTQMREDVAGLEATIIMHPQIWKASGTRTPSLIQWWIANLQGSISSGPNGGNSVSSEAEQNGRRMPWRKNRSPAIQPDV